MLSDTWWKEGPIYQIYPRSFLDSNGDGVGDLNGIISKLDYLSSLGIRGIWLSPIYPSPMFDFGYDISCYHDVDPVFGSLDDLKTLISEAEKRGIGIIMDMVLNHTSYLHPWFIEASSSRDNPKRDWYIWKDPERGLFGRKKPPNNWMAAFGGRAWTFDKKTAQYYLHLFTRQQPDLNWRNPAVKKALLDELRFFLDLGVKGFRLDVINYLVKDSEFRNNPYRLRLSYPRRHDMQHHAFDRNQKETYTIVKELRDLMDEYPASMLVGEVYPDEGVQSPELAASYLGKDGELLHSAFDFSLMYTPFKAQEFRKNLERWYSCIPENSQACHVLSNHDQSRAVSRYKVQHKKHSDPVYGDAAAKLLACCLLTQQGSPYMYYGEEIGMGDGRIARKDMKDPLGIKYYPFHPGRDRSRTPMQWDSTVYAGFSSAKPWLPVNNDYLIRNAAAQEADPDSLLVWYKKLIALRHNEAALHKGNISFHDAKNKDVLLYIRSSADRQIGILLNFSRKLAAIKLSEQGEVLLSSCRKAGETIGQDCILFPLESTLFIVQ